MAAAEQDPLKLGAKGNLHLPLLSWNRSVRGAEGSSRNFHLKRAESTKAASFPALPPSSKRRRRSSGEGKHRNHKLEPQHGQRKLVEIFQLGNRSSQAIKCFSQTHSLTALGPPCSISHTARLATYKIKASDHKHKKELCSAFRALQQPSSTRRNRACPHFLQEEVSTSKNPTLQPWQQWPLDSERSPGDPSQGKIFRRALCSPLAEPCPGCLAHLAFQLWVWCFQFLEGLGAGEPHPHLLWTL